MQDTNRKIPPLIFPADEINYMKPAKSRLASGIPVYLLDGTRQEIVKIEFVFRSGSYQQKKPLVAQTVANLLKSGTKKRSSEEINHIWDFYGASLQVDAQKDIITVTVFCLTRHLRPILDILTEMLSESVFPEEEISVFLNNMRQRHIVNMKKVQHVARLEFTLLLYGKDHPYGIFAREDDFKSVNRDDLLGYYNEYIQPGNAVCIIAGNFPEEILNIMDDVFRKYSWNQTQLNGSPVFDLKGTDTSKHMISMDGAVQSAIRLGKTIINRDHPQYHKVSVTNTLLGGYFGSRLMQNIRQDKGYTYGIGSSIVTLLESAYFFISSQVGKDVCEMAMQEVYSELRNLRQKPAGILELKMLQNYLSASMLRSFDGPFQQSERFKEMLLFDLDHSHFDNYLSTLSAIRPSDIQETAEEFFNEKDMIELIVG
jgi:zinc protease